MTTDEAAVEAITAERNEAREQFGTVSRALTRRIRLIGEILDAWEAGGPLVPEAAARWRREAALAHDGIPNW